MTHHAAPGDRLMPVHQEFVMPISELPPIDADAVPLQEFWSRRNVRPKPPEGGMNFGNVPILGVGIRFVGDTAALSTPTMEGYNAIVDSHNPGAFRFALTDADIDKARDFLEMISMRNFPWSRDRSTEFEAADIFRRVLDYSSQSTLVTVPAEHSLADHGGGGLFAPSEVGKFAGVSEAFLEFADKEASEDAESFLVRQTVDIDEVHQYLSHYVTLPVRGTTPFEEMLKGLAMGRVRMYQDSLNARTMGSGPGEDHVLEIDFGAINANLERLQAKGRDRSIGMVAVAS